MPHFGFSKNSSKFASLQVDFLNVFFLIFDAYNYLIKKIEVKHPHLSAVLNGWKNIQNFSEKTR